MCVVLGSSALEDGRAPFHEGLDALPEIPGGEHLLTDSGDFGDLNALLQRLVEEGLLDRVRYQQRPDRYEYVITEKGEDFYRS
ncbi:winged helix-turn-helix transcriptional regulator [Saccharopolyspora pogona]|uniref:winged helix-turn-helix transcriptional regulator n=1 Tax=Saccharopolyspora pogona TaxID=333966 RepID=UPI001689EAF8